MIYELPILNKNRNNRLLHRPSIQTSKRNSQANKINIPKQKTDKTAKIKIHRTRKNTGIRSITKKKFDAHPNIIPKHRQTRTILSRTNQMHAKIRTAKKIIRSSKLGNNANSKN